MYLSDCIFHCDSNFNNAMQKTNKNNPFLRQNELSSANKTRLPSRGVSVNTHIVNHGSPYLGDINPCCLSIYRLNPIKKNWKWNFVRVTFLCFWRFYDDSWWQNDDKIMHTKRAADAFLNIHEFYDVHIVLYKVCRGN